MQNQYQRMEKLLGQDAAARLKTKRVAVFGVGGVGGSVVEALARSGIGTIDVIDNDVVDPTNINRQALAVWSTVGRSKVDVAEERIHDIDPEIIVHKYPVFYLPPQEDRKNSDEAAGPEALQATAEPENSEEKETAAAQEERKKEENAAEEEAFGKMGNDLPDFACWDYVVDAIDTVTGKIGIILTCKRLGIPVLSCMGCGNRLDPTKLTVCDIYETKTDPLAKIMRHELRKRGVKDLTVVYSTEPAIRRTDGAAAGDCKIMTELQPANEVPEQTGLQPENTDTAEPVPQNGRKKGRRDIPGSSAFVPPAAGLIAASVVVRDFIASAGEA